jgi:hypothetical protein
MSDEQVTLEAYSRLAEGEPVAKRRLEKPRHIPRTEGSVTTGGINEVLAALGEDGGEEAMMHRRLDRSNRQRRLYIRFKGASREDELAGRLAEAWEDASLDRFELDALWGMFEDDKPVLKNRRVGLYDGE